MDAWSTSPPPEDHRYSFDIVRTPASKPLIGITTSTDIVGRMTHFAKNRTIPCDGEETCPWCQEGYSARWHGYLAAVSTDTFQHFLFEFTAKAGDPFKNYLLQYLNIRACQFRAFRPSGKSNGRVSISCRRLDETKLRLPDPPNVRRILCHIWNIPYTENQPTRMNRPPFKDLGIMPDDDDGRYKPDKPK